MGLFTDSKAVRIVKEFSNQLHALAKIVQEKELAKAQKEFPIGTPVEWEIHGRGAMGTPFRERYSGFVTEHRINCGQIEFPVILVIFRPGLDKYCCATRTKSTKSSQPLNKLAPWSFCPRAAGAGGPLLYHHTLGEETQKWQPLFLHFT